MESKVIQKELQSISWKYICLPRTRQFGRLKKRGIFQLLISRSNPHKPPSTTEAAACSQTRMAPPLRPMRDRMLGLLMACPMAAERLEGWEAFKARLALEIKKFCFAICRYSLAYYLLRRWAVGKEYEAIGHVHLLRGRRRIRSHGDRKVSLPLGSPPLDGVGDNYGFFPSIHWKKGNAGEARVNHTGQRLYNDSFSVDTYQRIKAS
ncbi:hypothetical protein M5K25_017053 [Dendrobium thyrsiflorum]|uniref:Uncharacterized protein n=1 Tax=Dendrobium thyrsiflorum TaxID=117978 RepID=A0ABD0UT55_DENTH